MRIRRFRLERARGEDASWLCRTLDREGRALGTHVTADDDGTLALHW
jgi:poly-gamma-glutamate capsule biosynthesis protein CapA/YwtB (metallophosphatase superfamily)